MSMQDTTADNGLTGTVLFYRQPEILSRDAHGKLGLNRSSSAFKFARVSNVAPLTVPEFGPASLSYPIIFAGDQRQPLAVMGLNDGENLFVTEEGAFEADAYIPMYVRRYPFVLAQSETENRMLVAIDRAYELIVEGGELPFFEGAEPSQYTKNSIQFCENFQQNLDITQSFVQLIKDLDLLETRTATYTPQNVDGTVGEPQKIADYFAVSEEKLAALPDAKILELRANGALQQIYVHLNSLFGWDRLIAKTLGRIAAEQQGQMTAANA